MEMSKKNYLEPLKTAPGRSIYHYLNRDTLVSATAIYQTKCPFTVLSAPFSFFRTLLHDSRLFPFCQISFIIIPITTFFRLVVNHFLSLIVHMSVVQRAAHLHSLKPMPVNLAQYQGKVGSFNNLNIVPKKIYNLLTCRFFCKLN